MFKRTKPADTGVRPYRGSDMEERDGSLWADGDDDVMPGRNWSVILIFAFVPLATLVALVLSLMALFSEVFGERTGDDSVVQTEVDSP